MLWTQDLYLILPGIFLFIMVVSLLLYGVVFDKIVPISTFLTQSAHLTILILVAITFLIYTQYLSIESLVFFNNLIQLNSFIIVIQYITTISLLIVVLLSFQYLLIETFITFEYFILLLCVLSGLYILLMANDLFIIYLGIELQSFSLYILATMKKNNELSTEAGIKYFLLGALSSGFLLLGCSFLYGITGLTSLSDLQTWLLLESNPMVDFALLFVAIGFLFKVTAAPFHAWVPDVYEGAPTLVTALFAIVPKLPLMAIFYTSFVPFYPSSLLLFSILLSLIVGTFGAVNQTKLKRMFAYSTIGHTGIMLLTFISNLLPAFQSLFNYLILYMIMTINSFSVILSLFKKTTQQFTLFIAELIGLSRSNPVLAWTLCLMLFSLAGIPPLSGFFIKWDIFMSTVQSEFYLIALIGILSSVVAAIYSIRIIHSIYFQTNKEFYHKIILDVLDPYIRIDVWKSVLLGGTLFLGTSFYIHSLPLYVLWAELSLLRLT